MTSHEIARVFVGASPSELLPLKVLEFTIREHASLPVEIAFMSDLKTPMPRHRSNQPGTNFSFYRFMIPELTGFSGKALYVDSDMMVFRDLGELWSVPFDGAQVLTVQTPEGVATKNHSVLLIDCAAVTWDIREIVRGLDEGRYRYDQLMRDLCIVPPDRVHARIPYVWNSLDRYEPDRTALLHFTALHSQPWTEVRHPHARVWVEALFRAVDAGAISTDMIRGEVEAGSVRPSLLHQVERRIADPAVLDRAVLDRDRQFVAPFRRLAKHSLAQRVIRKARVMLERFRPRTAS